MSAKVSQTLMGRTEDRQRRQNVGSWAGDLVHVRQKYLAPEDEGKTPIQQSTKGQNTGVQTTTYLLQYFKNSVPREVIRALKCRNKNNPQNVAHKV